MPTIDRSQLQTDQLAWLPDDNVISTTQMSAISENIISAVGDDSENYAEILCKSLRGIAYANLSKYVVDTKNIKKEKVDKVEIERFENISTNPWKEYLDSLQDICPLFGYTGLGASMPIRIIINNGTKISADTCKDLDESNLYL